MATGTDRPAIAIGNAGLVLLHPFLPHLFDRLGLRAPGQPHLAGPDAAARAVHLLQYVVDGRRDAPDSALPLNKLLCGLPVTATIAPGIAAEPHALEICDAMLRAALAQWSALKGSSVVALRETFLQRSGRLTPGEDRWNLRAARRTLDLLVDQIPWNIALVHHPWMTVPLHVAW